MLVDRLLACLLVDRIGGLTVPFDILAEFIPTKDRGRYLLLIEYYWTAGSMLVPIIAYYTIELADSWRLFVAVCAIPCIISLFAGMMYVPESPRWLILKGRNEEALHILRKAALMNGKDPRELFPQGCYICNEEAEEGSSCMDLFQPKWKRITLLLFVVWAGFALCYYGTIMTVTRIFNESNGDDDDDLGKATFDYSAIFISSSAEVIGTAIAIALVDRIGRIQTTVGAYVCGGVSLFALCFVADHSGRTELVVLSFAARVCEMVGSCTLWIVTAEIFSTDIRSTGHSATNAVARLGGFCSPYLVGNTSFRAIAFVMLVAHLVVAFCASRLPETKGVELGRANTREQEERYEPTCTELI